MSEAVSMVEVVATVKTEHATVTVYEDGVQLEFHHAYELVEFPGDLGFKVNNEPYCIAWGRRSPDTEGRSSRH